MYVLYMHVAVSAILGTFVSRVGIDVSSPYGIAFDAESDGDTDSVYIAETAKGCITVYDINTKQRVKTIGSKGNQQGQFVNIFGLCVDDRCVYAVDNGLHRIAVFDKKSGAFITMFGSNGTQHGEFSNPFGICCENNYLYVSEYGNHRVQIFNKPNNNNNNNFTFVRSIGSKGSGDGQLNGPYGIAVDSNSVYIAETGKHCITVYKHKTTS